MQGEEKKRSRSARVRGSKEGEMRGREGEGELELKEGAGGREDEDVPSGL